MTADFIDPDGYRANVGIILTDGDSKVLVARRAGARGWQFPQGGIRPEEELETAVYRELHEEIGLETSDVELLGRTHAWLRYKLPRRYQRRDSKPLCIGQKQMWFLLQLTSDDSKVHLDSTDSPEFDRWRWVDYWQPPRDVIFFKREVYEQALQELEQYAPVSGNREAERSADAKK